MDLIAKSALILWIPVALLLINTLGPGRGAVAAILGGGLLLPNFVGFDFPSIPPLGKQEITALSVLFGALLFHPTRLTRIRLGFGVDMLVIVMILGGVGTALTNSDVLVYGERVVPAMTRYDSIANISRDMLSLGLPFLLGRAFVRTRRDLQNMLIVMITAALLYSTLVLVELRMAPQVHSWVYGFQGSFALNQHFRYGGYRPLVFMPHGLALASFLAMATIAAMCLVKTRLLVMGQRTQPIGIYLGILVYLCKSMASMVYAAVGTALLVFTKPKRQVQISAFIGLLVLLYPATRILGLFPTEPVVSAFSKVHEVRANSLRYRFAHEDLLIDKARSRMLLGWGSYNRNRVFDKETGTLITVTDGAWIIYLGTRGVVGMLAFFGLLTLPVFVTQRRFHLLEEEHDRVLVGGLTLIVAISALDLLPNGLFTYWPLFYAGSLLGTVQHLTSSLQEAAPRRRTPAAAAPPLAAAPAPFVPEAAGPALAEDDVADPAYAANPERPASLSAARRIR